jgi:hypothetical protein
MYLLHITISVIIKTTLVQAEKHEIKIKLAYILYRRGYRICRPFWLFMAPENARSCQFMAPEIAISWQFMAPETASYWRLRALSYFLFNFHDSSVIKQLSSS